MTKSKLEDDLRIKIKNVNKLLPYPQKAKENLINNYFQDLKEEIGESDEIPPDLLINSRQIAKQLAKSQEWPIINASLIKRSIAYIIDLFFSLFFGIMGLIIYFFLINLADPNFYSTERPLLPAMTIFLITMSIPLYTMLFYPFLSEGFFSKTIGKKLTGLIVINDDKLKITWNQALIRSLTKVFPLLLFFESFIGFYQIRNSQRIMDSIANTIVIEINYESMVDQYLSQVVNKIPNHRNELSIPLESLKQEIIEALNTEGIQNPIDIFGFPEDVAKNIVKSSNWKQNDNCTIFRFFAYCLDLIFSIVMGIILTGIIGLYIDSLFPYYFTEINTIGKFFVFLFVASMPLYALVFYPILFEGYYSRTIGKWKFRLWIVDESGIKISWNQAVIRSLTKVFPILLLIEAFYMIKDRTTKRKLDKIALTRVVKLG